VVAVFDHSGNRRQAEQQVDAFYRLFMAPGMGHCLWGPGPSQVHALAAVRHWVEDDRPPANLIAAQVTPPSMKPDAGAMRRPLCPYPQYAHYSGGNPQDPGSFHCTTGARHDRH
jgi:feruloyl esterase